MSYQQTLDEEVSIQISASIPYELHSNFKIQFIFNIEHLPAKKSIAPIAAFLACISATYIIPMFLEFLSNKKVVLGIASAKTNRIRTRTECSNTELFDTCINDLYGFIQH